MGSLNLNILKNTSKNINKYVYTDLHLDITTTPNDINGNFIIQDTSVRSKDIKVDYDINAIRNSLINLFNTGKNERFLLPDYGTDIRRFIFEPITQHTGEQIGRTIKEAIQKWEPRVIVSGITITGYEDIHQYSIMLVLEIPTVNKQQKLTLQGVLNREGFIF